MAKEEKMDIKKLHQECKEGKEDLYSYIAKKFPDKSTEERLKVMAHILNDYLEEYEYDQKNKLKENGYLITKFFPKS